MSVEEIRPTEQRRRRVLIPLDADEALRALMRFHHSQTVRPQAPERTREAGVD